MLCVLKKCGRIERTEERNLFFEGSGVSMSAGACVTERAVSVWEGLKERGMPINRHRTGKWEEGEKKRFLV